jgi:hypothetical protein
MGMYDPVAFVGGSRKLSRDAKAKIVGGNAAKLLKIRAPKTTASRKRPAAKKAGSRKVGR